MYPTNQSTSHDLDSIIPSNTVSSDTLPSNTVPGRVMLIGATMLVGLSAGFFFTYEASVTLGLAQVGDAAYVETFQAVNETVSNPAFGIVFFGSIPAIAAAIAVNWRSLTAVPRALVVAALPLYLAGLLITGTGNVPLNNDLAVVDRGSAEDVAAARAEFEDEWNRLNLLRSLAIGASFGALAIGGVLAPSRLDVRCTGANPAHTG